MKIQLLASCCRERRLFWISGSALSVTSPTRRIENDRLLLWRVEAFLLILSAAKGTMMRLIFNSPVKQLVNLLFLLPVQLPLSPQDAVVCTLASSQQLCLLLTRPKWTLEFPSIPWQKPA